MSNRERWIVYPLLFFAILAGLKNQLVSPLEAEYESIKCKRLLVVSTEGKTLIELASSIEARGEEAGLMVMYGPSHAGDGLPLTNIASHPRMRRMELGTDDGGGYIKSYGATGAPTIKMGHLADPPCAGMIAENGQGQLAPARRNFDSDFWGNLVRWEDDSRSNKSLDP